MVDAAPRRRGVRGVFRCGDHAGAVVWFLLKERKVLSEGGRSRTWGGIQTGGRRVMGRAPPWMPDMECCGGRGGAEGGGWVDMAVGEGTMTRDLTGCGCRHGTRAWQ